MRLGSTARGREPYLVVVGVVVGLLLGGLVLPLAVGERTVTTTTDLAGSGIDDFAADGSDTGSAAGSGGLDGSATDPGTGIGPGGPGSAAGPGGPSGPGSTTGPGGPGGSTGGPGGTTRLTATDVGVTSSEIRVGFLIMDLGGAAELGFNFPGIDPAVQEAVYQGYVDDINERGGINGRRIAPVFETYDVTDRDDMLRACRALTKDAKVFAVLGQFTFTDPVLCVTEQGRTPMIAQMTQGLPTFLLERSRGLLFSLVPSAPRTMKTFAAELHRSNEIGNRKVGIFADEFLDPGGREGTVLQKALEAHGYTVAHRSRLTADVGVANSQVPIELNEMATKGVGIVLMLANSLSSQSFVQQAEKRGFLPKYAVTDFASMTTDGNNANMPQSYNGALAITALRINESKVGRPEPAPAVECRQLAERRTARSYPRDDGSYYVMTQECAMVRIFERAALMAGAELTRGRLSAAIQRLGNVPAVDSVVGGGAFAPGKYDYADYVRAARWEFACKCWKPADEFRQVTA